MDAALPNTVQRARIIEANRKLRLPNGTMPYTCQTKRITVCTIAQIAFPIETNLDGKCTGLRPLTVAAGQVVGIVCSTPRTTRRVLQTSQKWPEIAGSKCRGFAKLGERFQRPSPKAVVLPLHHSPRVLNNIRDLTGILRVLASDRAKSRAKTPNVAPFYSFPPGLGKRAEMGLVRGVAAKRWQFPGAGRVPVSGHPAHERVFRGAGFSSHRDGRAQPAAAAASRLRPRHLRDKTRRRVFDVEPVQGSRVG